MLRPKLLAALLTFDVSGGQPGVDIARVTAVVPMFNSGGDCPLLCAVQGRRSWSEDLSEEKVQALMGASAECVPRLTHTAHRFPLRRGWPPLSNERAVWGTGACSCCSTPRPQ